MSVSGAWDKLIVAVDYDPQDRVWVDFNKGAPILDDAGNVTHWTAALTTFGSQRDIERLGLSLYAGASLRIWADDADHEGKSDPLIGEGVVFFFERFQYWGVNVHASQLKRRSELLGTGE
jgi:hypothetical protein